MKLVKLLQTQGIASRKGGIALIRAEAVQVHGQTCTDPDAEFDPEGLGFTVDGVAHRYRRQAYIALNKPADYECSRAPRHHRSVFELIPPELIARGVQPVGRLDQDTTGLLLLSDDGQFIHRLISPKHKVPKVYHADCADALTDAQLEALVAGVVLNDEPQPVAAVAARRRDGHGPGVSGLGVSGLDVSGLDVSGPDQHGLELVLTEGKYHQVKRMVATIGNHVERLHRASIGGLGLGELAPGEWRWLEAADLAALEQH